MKYYTIIKDGVIVILMLLGLLYILDTYVFQIPYHSSNVHENSYEQIVKEDEAKKEKIKKISEVIWCENRASKTSMELVLSVIINRAKDKSLDGLYTEVIKPFQFSCLNDKKIIQTQRREKKDIEMMKVAEVLVDSFLNGQFVSKTKAKFYYAPSKVSKPKYLKNKPLLMAFEDHHFY